MSFTGICGVVCLVFVIAVPLLLLLVVATSGEQSEGTWDGCGFGDGFGVSMAACLPRAPADLQRLVARVSIDAEQPAYAYRGDFSALYHLVDERLGDAQIIGDLCHLEELVAPRKICSVLALSISRRHRPGTTKVHICIISLFVNSYVPYKSHLAGHFVNIPSHRAPRVAFVSWHLSNALAFQRRFLHGGGDAYNSC